MKLQPRILSTEPKKTPLSFVVPLIYANFVAEKSDIVMNKSELIAAVAERCGISKANAAKNLEAVLGVIADNVCEGDNEVNIPDFGRFFVKSVPERQGMNPLTKEKMVIPAHDKVVFKPSANLSIYSRKHNK